MRVLFWSPGFLPEIGGIEVLAAQYLPAMRARGYEYVVVTSQNTPNLPTQCTYQEIPIYRLPFWQSLVNLDQLGEAKRQVTILKHNFSPDLIHIYGPGRDVFFYLLTANAHRAPLLVTLHGEWVLQADAIVSSVLQSAAWIVGCSNAILDKGRRLAPEIIPRSSVIRNAVEKSSLSPKPLPLMPQRLLCLGRLSKEKGFDLALTAFASVVKRFPYARLVVAGDGPERASLEKQAVEIGVVDSVDFLGWIAPENVPALINSATIVLIPSRFESLPLVALEAALLARPVVGTRVGGIPEVVVDQKTGLLVKNDADSLADAISLLLQHPATATKIGQAARLRAQQAFSWERHVDAYDLLYQKLIYGEAKTLSL